MPTTQHFVNFRDRPIVYARVPKVANTSIKVALTKLLTGLPEGKNRITSDNFWKKMTNGETEMVSARTAWKMRREKMIFSFVRNPFDRLVSCYNNKILNEASFTPQMAENGFSVGMGFPDFVKQVSAQEDSALDIHMASQSYMLLYNGQLVPRFIGHFEDIDPQWGILRRRINKKYDIQLPRLPKKNVRREDHADVARYFESDAVAEMVAERYAKDIELFYPGVGVDKLIAGEFEVPKIAKPVRKKDDDEAADEADGKGDAES